MKNSLKDLNYYLYEQLDRLTNDDLKGDDLEKEIGRAKAVTDTATQIIKNTQSQLRAAELFIKSGKELPANNTMNQLLIGGAPGDGE